MNRVCLLAAACVFLAGPACNKEKKNEYKKAEDPKPKKHAHHHEHGPNGGHLMKLGDAYRAEVTIGKGEMHIFIFASDGKTAVGIDEQDITFHLEHADGEKELIFKPAKKDKDGKVIQFTYQDTDKKIPSDVDNIEKVKGHAHGVKVGDKTYDPHL